MDTDEKRRAAAREAAKRYRARKRGESVPLRKPGRPRRSREEVAASLCAFMDALGADREVSVAAFAAALPGPFIARYQRDDRDMADGPAVGTQFWTVIDFTGAGALYLVSVPPGPASWAFIRALDLRARELGQGTEWLNVSPRPEAAAELEALLEDMAAHPPPPGDFTVRLGAGPTRRIGELLRAALEGGERGSEEGNG